MIYTDSKGREIPVEHLEDFHLYNAHKKVQSMRNKLGYADRDIARYIEMVCMNLWREIERRSTIKNKE